MPGNKDDLSDVLSGQIDRLPPLPSKTVKIYICSNASEFEVERQILWSQALPELHHCCLYHGFDLELVDVHQGTELDHVKDSYAFEQHIQELQECSELSNGPFFLCLLGDKYGQPPLPVYLEEAEFIHIHNKAFTGDKDVKLLDEWYRKDENSTPPVYRLLPIRHKFKHHGARDHLTLELADQEASSWTVIYTQLLDIIQFGAREAFKEGLINQVHRNKQERFFLSGLEQELQMAFEKSVKGCICVMRSFENLNEDHGSAESFIDTKTSGKVDKEAQKHLQSLKEFISVKLNEKNKLYFNIPWVKNGVVPHISGSHYKYIDNFNATVVSRLKTLIEEAAKSSCSLSNTMLHRYGKPSEALKDEVSAETFPHLYRCQELSEMFVQDGFETELEELRKLLTAGSCVDHKPVFVFGPESSGKSSLLAYLACQVAPETLGKELILVPRFLDVAKHMSKNYSLKSISKQIYAVLRVDLDFMTQDRDMLNSSYQKLLQTLSGLSAQLLILLDGLSAPDGVEALEEELSWLNCRLPPRVHIIVSFTEDSTNKSNDTQNNRMHQPNNSKYNVVLLKPRGRNRLTECFHGMLSRDKRTLQQEQECIFINAALSSQSLHHLALMADQSKQCMSWDSGESGNFSIGHSFQESVMKVFENVETKHGLVFVSQMAKYLTLARHGLTEMEILDLLSGNNDILLACFPEELPPVLRFPVSLWLAIKADLEFLLTRYLCDNKQLYCWAHQSTYLVARQRYLQQPVDAREAHKHLAELFLESWIDNKPLINKDRNIQRIDCGSRLICPQPLLYSETKYNMRRISEMWHHLLHAGEQDSFREYAYCCFDYLLATAHSTSIQNLFTHLESALSCLLDAEVNLVLSAMKLSLDILLEDPLQLASELIGRLRPLKEYYPYTIDSLVTQCMQWCDSYSLPLVVPLTTWLPDPRKSLITSLEVSDGITRMLHTQNSQHILCAMKGNTVNMYHVPSRKLVTTFQGHEGLVVSLCISYNHKFVISGADDGSIKIWDMYSGQCTKTISEHSSIVLSVTVSHDDALLVSGSRDKTVMIYKLDEEKVLHKLRQHSAPVTAVTFNSSDSILITASVDKTVVMWDMEDMTMLNCINDVNSSILCMDLSVDNTFLLIGCEDGSVHVYSFTTGSEVHQLKGHRGKVSSLAVSQDCVHAVIGCVKGCVYIYNLCTTELLRMFSGRHKSPVTSVRISYDESMIFTASKKRVCVWNMYKERTKEVVDDNHTGPVTAVAINAAGKLAVTGGKDGLLKLWNLDLSVFTENLSGHLGPVTCVILGSEESFVLSGSEDQTLKVWSITLACVVTDYQQHQSAIKCAYILCDNMRIMSVDMEDRLKLWMADTGQTLFSYTEPIPVMAVSPNSEYVFSMAEGYSLKVWKLEDSSVIQTISHKGEITCVTCTEDSEYVITGSDDMSLKVWETRTGKLTQVLVEHQGTVSCITTTRNSSTIISGSHDSSIIIWNLATGSVEHLLECHKGVVTVLRVTSDGSILVSGSRDGTLRVWNLQHGTQLTLFDMHAEVEDLVMTFDASNIVVRLANNCHVPLLCLHNTPAAEVKSQSQVSIQVVSTMGGGDCLPLPLKPHPQPLHTQPSMFTAPKELKRKESRFSVSSVPEIIQVSPIKAPVQTAIKAQEKKKGQDQKAKKTLKREVKTEDKNRSKSGICTML